jgi:hypothetical protein
VAGKDCDLDLVVHGATSTGDENASNDMLEEEPCVLSRDRKVGCFVSRDVPSTAELFVKFVNCGGPQN